MEQKELITSIGEDQIYTVAWEGRRYYLVEHVKSGTGAIFDHERKYLDAIPAECERRGGQNGRRKNIRSLTSHARNRKYPPSLCWLGRSNTPTLYLSQFLYAQYKGIPIDEVRKGRVAHVNGVFLPNGWEDCRSSNLAMTTDVILSSEERTFEVIQIGRKQYIKLTLHNYPAPNNETIVEYSETMLDILARPNSFTFSVDYFGRIIARRKRGGKHYSCHFSALVCAIYDGAVTSENIEDAFRITKERRGRGLDVDHLNSDKLNNTTGNLSLMPSSVNASKRGYTAAFGNPYSCFYAYDRHTGEYLIEATFGAYTQFIRCKSAEVLNDWLKEVQGRCRLTQNTEVFIVRGGGNLESIPTPKQVGSNQRTRAIEEDIAHADALLSMPREKFIDWKIGQQPTVEQFANLLGQIYGCGRHIHVRAKQCQSKAK